MALIKIIDGDEAAGDELVLMAQTAAAQAAAAQEVADVKKVAVKAEPAAPFQPAKTWSPIEDLTEGYNYSLEEKKDFAGRKVKLIQNSCAEGLAEGKGDWRGKLKGKEEMIHQVKTDLHYWYGEGYGSERRKKPA